MMPRSEIRHASTVVMHGVAVMIEGPSGSGKSALALDLMALGAELVADDRTLLFRLTDDGEVLADAPPSLPALIEARGVGLLPTRLAGPSRLGLVVDLGTTETARLPEPHHINVLGQMVTLLRRPVHGHFPQALAQYMKGQTGP